MRISQSIASSLLLALIIILFITGIIFAIITFRSNPVDDILAANRVINTLFIIESDEFNEFNEKKPLSTYVLMYYPATRRTAIFDIPGELGLLITRINRVDRIDRVYDPLRIGSFENEIEKLLGIDINFYIIIPKEKLVSLVDLLEGVEIFIPSPLSYQVNNMNIIFPSGITVLDGDRAGVYATHSIPEESRETEVSRKQRFFLGLLNRWIIMNDKFKEPLTAKLYYSFFKTSMNQRTFLRLFDEFINIDTDRTIVQSVGGNLREISDQMLIIPHYGGNHIKEVVRQTMGTLTRQVEDPFNEMNPTVEVLNGTAITGLAGRTAVMLRSLGYDVISTGNAERNNFDSTLIIYRSTDEDTVRTFAELIRCTNIRREYSLPDDIIEDETEPPAPASMVYDLKADITLIIGRNFDGRYVTGN